MNAVGLAAIRRGVIDPQRAAAFYAWLLGVISERLAGGFRIRCTNGDLLLDDDISTPVGIVLSAPGHLFQGNDPDGVPVSSRPRTEPEDGLVTLDHVRLNCADLAATARFYRELGLVITWSGVGERFLDGVQDEPIAGADWVHLSGGDGYLSLSQADWKDYGVTLVASGPPRFIHIGLAVKGLADIVARLDAGHVPYTRGPHDPRGERLYLNDPDGDAALGPNLELNEYVKGLPRSGRV